MFKVEVTHRELKTGCDTTIIRKVNEDTDLQNVLGEMLYGVECQTHDFQTHEVFEAMKDVIPANEAVTWTTIAVTHVLVADETEICMSFIKPRNKKTAK